MTTTRTIPASELEPGDHLVREDVTAEAVFFDPDTSPYVTVWTADTTRYLYLVPITPVLVTRTA